MTQQPDPIFELIRRWRQARANFKGARRLLRAAILRSAPIDLRLFPIPLTNKRRI